MGEKPNAAEGGKPQLRVSLQSCALNERLEIRVPVERFRSLGGTGDRTQSDSFRMPQEKIVRSER